MKKGQLPVHVLISLAIAAMLFLAGCAIAVKYYKSYTRLSGEAVQSYTKLIGLMDDINKKVPGTSEVIPLSIDPETVLAFFKQGNVHTYVQIAGDTASGYEIIKPLECSGKTCMCLCRELKKAEGVKSSLILTAGGVNIYSCEQKSCQNFDYDIQVQSDEECLTSKPPCIVNSKEAVIQRNLHKSVAQARTKEYFVEKGENFVAICDTGECSKTYDKRIICAAHATFRDCISDEACKAHLLTPGTVSSFAACYPKS